MEECNKTVLQLNCIALYQDFTGFMFCQANRTQILQVLFLFDTRDPLDVTRLFCMVSITISSFI